MRILYLNGHPVWTYGLPWGFCQLGQEVRVIPEIERDHLFDYVDNYRPDLIMTVGWIDQYVPAKLRVIKEAVKRAGCCHAYWATEDINHHRRWSLPLVKTIVPNVVFTINRHCIASYRQLGIPAWHLEFGFNPTFTDLSDQGGYDQDLVLVANAHNIWQEPDCFRAACVEILVRPLVEKGYNLVIWGEGWQEGGWPELSRHCRGPLPFGDSFRVYRRSKIVLNLQNQNQYSTQTTSRTFEITGSGGFQLTVGTPAVRRLFKNFEHLVLSRRPEETIALVDYFLRQDEERLAIARQGQAAVLANHTYAQRAEYLLSCIEKTPNYRGFD